MHNAGHLINKQDGITLIELIIVVSVIAILVVTLGFEYRNWMGRYRVENQAKQMHADLMNARARAMTMNRTHFLAWTTGSYTIYEDTNPAPDGNGTLEQDSDVPLPTYPKTVEYAIDWKGSGTHVSLDRRGMMTPEGSMRLTTTNDADYDCLTISRTRINMGKWNEDGASCVEK